jgi:hypothetical protein
MESRDFLLVCWSFALYPVFTAILIHLYNCTNPNSIIADVAKSNLVRGLATIDRLCYLSSTAKHISTIVKQLVTSSPIFKGDPAFCEILQTEVTQATQSPPDAMEVQERDFNWINQLYAPSPLNVKGKAIGPHFFFFGLHY